ncbi:hypothetical protein [Ruminiclostridium cellulolyticum]|uniref:Uncharacterized protein n=1 Tax=Ruminiclostridium cellulolyticum (strain ATCC 35319 / DSM 5812 / JCM 6584 / H10) TaxID=394503 RepID=B8I4K6_RUMCH|nr:hypothetical protein [Ruminiclostridium cellulolyticum]ACL74560.1 hypothetical protein Ccel_0172 [Ruminiclostridium cellulolyticum H10]
MGNAYERQYHIFKTMDNNWENPSGFIKVEINDDNTRFQLSLNNLSDNKDSTYSLYGIQKDNSTLEYTDICRILPVNGRVDIKTNFSSDEIGSNKLNVHDINIFAVIYRSTDKSSGTVKCPLVAYAKGEQVWKGEFERVLEQPSLKIEASAAAIDADDTAEIPVAIQNEKNDEPETEDINIQSWTVLDDEYSKNPIELLESEGTEREQENIETYVSEEVSGQENIESYVSEEVSGQETDISDLSSKFQGDLSSVYQDSFEGEMEENDESGDNSQETGEVQDVWKKIQDDFNDISSIRIDESANMDKSETDIEHPLNIQLLKQELDNSFEEFNPFKTRNRSYKWWKINSPGFLNNILFRNNIKTYLLFNPKVMLAHYKYRYIILGLRNNRQPQRERLICGIPGVYNIDDNPFGSEGSWVQMEGYRPKYGAFGYWIVTLDPRTGKISKMK